MRLTGFKVAQGPVWQPELGKMGSVFCHVKPGKKNLIGWGRANGNTFFV